MKALILSGGTGSRLRPLTFTNAKQLIPVANKPTLYYIIEKVVNLGIKDIGIIVGDTQEEIKAAIGCGDRWNANISYIYQPVPLGLAHAVKTAGSFIGNSDFLMILGDNLFSMELDRLLETFYSTDSHACLLLHRVQNPQEYGVAAVVNSQIVKLVEKPKDFISDYAITGVYIFDEKIFEAINRTQPSPRGELEITDAIQELLNMGGKVTYQPTIGWWKDTGKRKDILEANQLVLCDIENKIQSNTGSSSSITGKIQVGKLVMLENCIIRGPVVIGDNTRITNSFIGPYTSIGNSVIINNCEVENSIILDNVLLESIGGRIDYSLIGRNSVIKGKIGKPAAINLLVGDHCEVCL